MKTPRAPKTAEDVIPGMVFGAAGPGAPVGQSYTVNEVKDGWACLIGHGCFSERDVKMQLVDLLRSLEKGHFVFSPEATEMNIGKQKYRAGKA